MRKKTKRILTAIILGIAVVTIAITLWNGLYREVPQPASITGSLRDQYLYGSVGAEQDAGIPYWIWLTLPRIFPEYLPGQGGYASLGLPWEESREMPVGLSKKIVGYVRVAGNCALCHAQSTPNGRLHPHLILVSTGHTAEIQKLLQFFQQCAKDPRFNADNILPEIASATDLSLVEQLLYRFYLIPTTRARLLNEDNVLLDQASWQHSKNPSVDSAGKKKQLEKLAASLQPEESAQVAAYLKGLP